VRLWRWFFGHLYTTLAWAYDAVAWLSSFGRWSSWRRTGLRSIVPGRRLLEVGCGTGRLLVDSLARGDQTIAVDASPQMARITMRRLRQRGRPAVVARARAQALPFAGGFFHAALSTFPSEYIFDPDVLAELHRILAPGGALVVVFSARILPVFLWDRLSRWVYDLAGQAPQPDPRWLSSFEAAGFAARFEIVEIPGASVFHIVAMA
jgi:ubiquinone/menaquinone biosynthesis C-methylase UbiE